MSTRKLLGFYAFISTFLLSAFLTRVLAADNPCGTGAICYPGSGDLIPDLGSQCPSSPSYNCSAGTYCDPQAVSAFGAAVYCCRECPTASTTGCGEADLQQCCIDGSLKYCTDSSLECRYVSALTDPGYVCRSKLCGGANQPCCTYSTLKCDSGIVCNTYGLCTPQTDYASPTSPSIFEIMQYDGPIIYDIAGLLSPVFKILFYAGIFVGIMGIIYSGYLLMVSEGDPGRAKEGKEQFTAAILGSLFILLSVFILRAIINSILGVDSGL